jgi:RNA polymerase sigma-70 factor (ECF subfamily)
MVLLTDRAIIDRVLHGRTDEFRELMLRYQNRVFRLASGVLNSREEAEDATQEAFLKAYAGLRTYRADSGVWPWLRRISLNVCLDRIRARFPCESLESLPETECHTDAPEIEALKQVSLERINVAIGGLPERYRAVIVLRYQEDLSYQEISELLGEPLSSVQTWLHRAKQMLARKLGVMEHEML